MQQTSSSVLAGSKSRLDGRPNIGGLARHAFVVEDIAYGATLAVTSRCRTDMTAQLCVG